MTAKIPPPPLPHNFPKTETAPDPLVGHAVRFRQCGPATPDKRGTPRRKCDTQVMVVVAPVTPPAEYPRREQVLLVQQGQQYIVPDRAIRGALRASARFHAREGESFAPPPVPTPVGGAPVPPPPSAPVAQYPFPVTEAQSLQWQNAPALAWVTIAPRLGVWQPARVRTVYNHGALVEAHVPHFHRHPADTSRFPADQIRPDPLPSRQGVLSRLEAMHTLETRLDDASTALTRSLEDARAQGMDEANWQRLAQVFADLRAQLPTREEIRAAVGQPNGSPPPTEEEERRALYAAAVLGQRLDHLNALIDAQRAPTRGLPPPAPPAASYAVVLRGSTSIVDDKTVDPPKSYFVDIARDPPEPPGADPKGPVVELDTRDLDAASFLGPWRTARRAILEGGQHRVGTIFKRRLPVLASLDALDAILPPAYSDRDWWGTGLTRAAAVLSAVRVAVEHAIREGLPPSDPIRFTQRMPGQKIEEPAYEFIVTTVPGDDGPSALNLTSTTAARSCERYAEDHRMGAVLPEAAYDKCGLSDAAEPPEHRNVAVPESFPNPGRGGGRRGAHANGFIYDSQNRLACDYCAASGNVRRQKCPFGYCQAVAACPKCKKTHAVDFTPAKHREMGCEREMKEVREDNRRLREGLAQGRLLRVSAFMSSTQPGMVDVIFQDAHRRDTVRVFPKALYDSFSLTKAVFLDEFEAAARGGTVPGASAGGAESATRAAPRGVPRTVDSRGQGGWSFNPPRTSAPPFVMPPMPDRRDVERLRREYPGRYEQIEALERRLHATSKGTPTYPNGPPPGLVPGQSYDDGRPDPLRGQRVIGDDFRGEVRARALGCDAKTPAHVVGGVIVPRTRIVAAIRAQHRVPQSVRIGAPDPAPEEPAPGPRPIPPPPPPPPVQAAPPRPRTPLVVRDAGFPARLLRVVIPFDDNWTSADPESFRYAVRPEGDPVELPWEDARDAHGRDILAFGPAIPTPRGPLFVTGSLIEELRRIAIPFRVLVEEFDVTDQFDFVATTAPESEDGPSAFTLVPYEAGYVPPELEYLGASAPRFRVAAFLKVNANWQTHRYAQFSETPVRFEEVRQWAQGKRPKRVRIEDIEPVRLHPASVPAQLLQLVLDRAHGGHAHADGLRALFRALTPSGARVNLDWSRDDGEHMLGPRLTLKGKAAEELGHELLVTSDLAAQLRRVGEAFGIPVEVRDVTNQYHLFATTAGAEYDHGSTFTVLPFGAGYLPPELQDLGARVPGYREKYVYRVIAVRPEDAKWQTERNRSGGHPSWPTTLPDVAAWAAAPRTPAAPPAARALATAEAVESTVARLRAELAASAEGARLEFPEDADSFGGPEPVRASQILAGVTPDGIESLVRQGREEEALALVRGVEQRLDAARSSAPLNVTAADVAPEGAFDAFLGGRPPVPVAPAEASATWAAARARTLRVLDAQLADAEASWREADAQVKRFLAKRDGKGMDRWEKVRNLHGERKLGLDRALAILNDTRDTRLSWPEAESAVASILRKLPPEPDSRRAPARPSVSMLPRAELASLASRRLAEARADADKLKRAMPRHFRSDRERDEWMQKDKISRERVTACETALEIASDAAVRDADADARVSDLWHRFPRAK